MDAEDVALVTRFPKEGIARAFEFFSQKETARLKEEAFDPSAGFPNGSAGEPAGLPGGQPG